MAYITPEEVKSIRKALKEEFGSTIKFSVTTENLSAVNISIIESSEIDFTRNPEYDYHTNSYECPYLDNRAEKVLERIDEIAKTAPDGEWYDNSDVMTDYFDVAYYVFVNVGKWNKPYNYTGEFAGQSKVVLNDTMFVFDDPLGAHLFERKAKRLAA